MCVTQGRELRPPHFGIREFKWDFPQQSHSASVAGHGWLCRSELRGWEGLFYHKLL